MLEEIQQAIGEAFPYNQGSVLRTLKSAALGPWHDCDSHRSLDRVRSRPFAI